MRISGYSGLAVVILCLIVISSAAEAAQPATAPAPTTLWSFLGIPQGLQKMQKFRDATVNRRGNRPNRERKPPLKKIADPANLEAGEPKVIQEAAKIKMAEDKAQQKIKAIKYLAEVGCGGCYEGVADALLTALDDCTEEVRLEAVKAFTAAAGDPCETCDGAGCCNAKSMTKLYEMGYAQDESGCYKERSSRVREAAREALKACQRVLPPAGPTPATVNGEGPEYTEDAEPAIGPRPTPATPVPDESDNGESDNGSQPNRLKEQGTEGRVPVPPPMSSSSRIVNPITLTGMSRVDEVEFANRQTGSYTPGPPAPGFQRKLPRRAIGHYQHKHTTVARKAAFWDLWKSGSPLSWLE